MNIIILLSYLIPLSIILFIFFNTRMKKFMELATTKAKMMENEALVLFEQHKKDYEDKQKELEERRITLAKQEIQLEEDRKSFLEKHNELLSQESFIENIKQRYEEKQDEMNNLLSNYTCLSKEEAKSILFDHLNESLNIERSLIIRRAEQETHEDVKNKVNYILALACSRYANEVPTEHFISNITLENDDVKGKLIGRDGRNIKAFELVSGVDILIDDTPNSISLSSFNIYRREIARKTLELLLLDGRINPSNIEKIYEKCREDMDESLLKEGERITLELAIGDLHHELKKFVGKMKYRASYGQNALEHSIEVAYLAGNIAGHLDADEKMARRAGLLHDIGKALTHEMGGNHVGIGFDLCKRYKEHPIVLNAILAHHGNEDIKSIECAAVCAGDKLSASRPGARKETLGAFSNRMKDLENMALKYSGVKNAYALNAGREIRVLVKSNFLKDAELPALARDIAKDIEQELQYPGEIKVQVIKESRATAYAR